MDINHLNQLAPPGWQGKYPPCRIQVDQEGELFHDGAPIIHPNVLQTIYSSVHLDEGTYYLEVDGKRCQLEVADTFFVVKRAELAGEEIRLRLSGGDSEPLDPESIWVGERDILYCRVRTAHSRPDFYGRHTTSWLNG
jgi:hypothetical protein